ncbi:hypothetical protein ACEN2J_00370 [Pseudorhodobacter sp. W20_MBD10_FR17]|uniref:hypothetical protein n=1 Tax=Pseudorhodobacter sp. W20_MBD10_FR17 TaxID=3240266 RepID=UPI003F9A3024
MAFLKTNAARRFTATLAATATAFALMTATAVPALADRQSDDFAKALAAIAAIAIVGSALTEKDDRRATAPHRPHRPQTQPSHREPQPRYEAPRRYEEPQRRYKEPHRNRRDAVLPAQCAIEVRDRRHISVAYGENCLRRAGVDQRLPRQCEISVGRGRTAYDENCLLNSGFRTQGRRR